MGNLYMKLSSYLLCLCSLCFTGSVFSEETPEVPVEEVAAEVAPVVEEKTEAVTEAVEEKVEEVAEEAAETS
jgi:hypothetical protein